MLALSPSSLHPLTGFCDAVSSCKNIQICPFMQIRMHFFAPYSYLLSFRVAEVSGIRFVLEKGTVETRKTSFRSFTCRK